MSQDEQDQGEKPAEAPASISVPLVTVERPDFNPRRSRPLLGGSLWISGALLWAYLVMGELVVHFELNELLAMLVVSAALGLAWYGAVRRAPEGKLVSKVLPGGLGIVLFCVALFAGAAAFGTTRQKSIEALTVAFWFPAVFAYWLGRRLVHAPKLELSRRERAGGIALWVVSSLGTAGALLSAMTRM